MAASGPMNLLPDARNPVPLGSGTVVRVLGEGGVARVYEIISSRLGVHRAVKVLKPSQLTQLRQRFETEMRITAQLRHPNIVQIHTVGDWHGLPFIEMELVQGITLDKLVKTEGALPLALVLSIGIAVCRALDYAHTCVYKADGVEHKGVLHHDLKPANVMIGNNGEVKLMDFGIATPVDVRPTSANRTFFGSLQYVAPEQLYGRQVDRRADLYSLGCVLYEMLSGRRAFPQQNMGEIVTARYANRFERLKNGKVRGPQALIALIERCLAREPKARYDSAQGIGAQLEKLLHRKFGRTPEQVMAGYVSPDPSERAAALRPSRRGLIRGLVISTLLLLLAGGASVGVYYGRDNETVQRLMSSFRPPETDQPMVKEPGPEDVALVKPDTPERSSEPAPPKQSSTETEEPGGGSTPSSKPRAKKTSSRAQAPKPKRSRTTSKGASSEPDSERKLIDVLAATYGTDDVSTILTEELHQGNHGRALKLLAELPPNALPRTRRVLFRVRALEGDGQHSAMRALLLDCDASDGELCVRKAKVLYGQGRYDEAMSLLSKCPSLPTALGRASLLEREALRYTALSLTAKYKQTGSDSIREQALESWFDVKYAYRAQRNHPHFSEANEHIRTLAQ